MFITYNKIDGSIMTYGDKVSVAGCDTIEIEPTKAELDIIENGGLYINGGFTHTDKSKTKILTIKEDEINKEFENTMKPYTSGYSQIEIDSFITQEKEALIVIGGGESDLINRMKVNNEESLTLAKKIIANSKIYKPALAAALKIKRQKLKDLKSK